MIRTYPLGTTGPRQTQGMRDIFRRFEKELAAEPHRVARPQPPVADRRRSAY